MALRRTEIHLDADQERRLRRLAADEGRSFDDLVHEALGAYLTQRADPAAGYALEPRHALPEDEWRASFTEVIERFHAVAPQDVRPEEIEAEITAAVEEVRRAQAARWATGE